MPSDASKGDNAHKQVEFKVMNRDVQQWSPHIQLNSSNITNSPEDKEEDHSIAKDKPIRERFDHHKDKMTMLLMLFQLHRRLVKMVSHLHIQKQF